MKSPLYPVALVLDDAALRLAALRAQLLDDAQDDAEAERAEYLRRNRRERIWNQRTNYQP